MEIIEKLKEYNKFVTGSWFTCEITPYNSVMLKYYYPGNSPVSRIIYVFDTLEEFLSSLCKDILTQEGFIQVKDK